MDKNLGVISGIMKFTSMRLDEISKKEHADLPVSPNKRHLTVQSEKSLTKGLCTWCGRVQGNEEGEMYYPKGRKPNMVKEEESYWEHRGGS